MHLPQRSLQTKWASTPTSLSFSKSVRRLHVNWCLNLHIPQKQPPPLSANGFLALAWWASDGSCHHIDLNRFCPYASEVGVGCVFSPPDHRYADWEVPDKVDVGRPWSSTACPQSCLEQSGSPSLQFGIRRCFQSTTRAASQLMRDILGSLTCLNTWIQVSDVEADNWALQVDKTNGILQFTAGATNNFLLN